jgi:cyclophilin family peptidyl-prolyl cis-trans isomerase
MKKVINIILAASLMAIVAGCGNNPKGGKTTEAGSEAEVQADSLVQAQKTMKTMEKIAAMPEEPVFDIVTSLGTIKVRLYADTPKHRENFAKLAFEGFFDGLQFHRIIKNFMIQGGDPLTKDPNRVAEYGTGGPGYQIEAEIRPEHHHKKGALAAARKGDIANPMKESSGSQFYIVQSEEGCRHLDGEYTIFGETIDGFDVIDNIAAVQTNPRGLPDNPIFIFQVKYDEELN